MVVCVNGVNDLDFREAVGLKNFRIDNDFEQLLTRAGKARFKNPGNAFQPVFKALRGLVERTFRRIAVYDRR